MYALQLISDGIKQHLDLHDAEDTHIQAMVLAQTTEKFSNDSSQYKCEVYIGKSPKDIHKRFASGKVHTLY